MRYRINLAGNRIVVATPEETHALRPAIAASLRSRRLSSADIEDFCQEVELVTWKAIEDQRIVGSEFVRPVDALLSFMSTVAWNLWRNHSRRRHVRCEALVDDLPDMIGPSPVPRLETRETLLRLAGREDIAHVLMLSLNGSRPELGVNLPRTTFWSRVAKARSVVRDIEAGRYHKPRQPIPPTPKYRKGKR